MSDPNLPPNARWNPDTRTFEVPGDLVMPPRNERGLALYGTVRDVNGVRVSVLESSTAGAEVKCHLLVYPIFGASSAQLTRAEARDLALALLQFSVDPEGEKARELLAHAAIDTLAR